MTDEIVLAVPDTHPWALREEVSLREFLRTRLVVRDAGSNSRWTVDAVLLGRGVLRGHGFHELRIKGVSFPREFVMVLPAVGEPTANVTAVMDLLASDAAHNRPASAA